MALDNSVELPCNQRTTAVLETPDRKATLRERSAGYKSESPLVAMCPHRAELHILWRENVEELEHYMRLVREGKSLAEARRFAQHVIQSRLCEVLKPFDGSGCLKIDSAFLMWKAEELQRLVQDQWRTGVSPKLDASTLDAINHKLDLIAGHMAKIQPVASESPALRVLPFSG